MRIPVERRRCRVGHGVVWGRQGESRDGGSYHLIRAASFARAENVPYVWGFQKHARDFLSSRDQPQKQRSARNTEHEKQNVVPDPKTALSNISSTQLHVYNIATVPNPGQLRRAKAFFTRHEATRLWRSPRFLDVPPTSWPEVAVIGRSNVGKSSLLNAIFGVDKPVASISSKPGHTRTMLGYGVGGVLHTRKKGHSKVQKERWELYNSDGGTLMLVDMPGYGGGSRKEWGEEIMKYFEKRKQLRKIYVLVDAEHGLKDSDKDLLLHFRQHAIPYQLVLNKVDKLLPEPRGKAKFKQYQLSGIDLTRL